MDDRANIRPGAKYFEWERKGVPLRIEFGLRDITGNAVITAIRYNQTKGSVQLYKDRFVDKIRQILYDIHEGLYARAVERLETRTYRLDSYEEMKRIIQATDMASTGRSMVGSEGEEVPPATTASVTDSNEVKSASEIDIKDSGSGTSVKEAGFYLVPWAENAENEAAIKADCKATIRCYPFDHNRSAPEEGVKCFYSGLQATHMALFARAF